MLDKIKAAGLHLFLSALIIFSFLAIVYFVWYPYPFYITEGLSYIIIILLGVDLVLGPVMTLILYKKKKKYLLLDLSIIIIIQSSAFIYGAMTIADGRPVYIVFATDVYKSVSPSMIDINTIKYPRLKYSFFSKPIYIYATAPQDPAERTKLLWDTLSGGNDIEQLPKYYQEYKLNLKLVREKKYSYKKQLLKNPELNQKLENTLNSHKLTVDEIGLYPFMGNEQAVVVVISLKSGRIIDYLPLSP